MTDICFHFRNKVPSTVRAPLLNYITLMSTLEKIWVGRSKKKSLVTVFPYEQLIRLIMLIEYGRVCLFCYQ